jgi:hypothetical protein
MERRLISHDVGLDRTERVEVVARGITEQSMKLLLWRSLMHLWTRLMEHPR